jgi:hypothetical protein
MKENGCKHEPPLSAIIMVMMSTTSMIMSGKPLVAVLAPQ